MAITLWNRGLAARLDWSKTDNVARKYDFGVVRSLSATQECLDDGH